MSNQTKEQILKAIDVLGPWVKHYSNPHLQTLHEAARLYAELLERPDELVERMDRELHHWLRDEMLIRGTTPTDRRIVIVRLLATMSGKLP